MSSRKLYLLITTLCLGSYFWIFYSFRNSPSSEICPFRQLTHWPCPSCGSTRAVLSILHGDLIQAWFLNPLGYVIALILLICPFWLLYDLVFAKDTLIRFYQRTENFVKKRIIALPLIFLISLNWIWNVIKGI